MQFTNYMYDDLYRQLLTFCAGTSSQIKRLHVVTCNTQKAEEQKYILKVQCTRPWGSALQYRALCNIQFSS